MWSSFWPWDDGRPILIGDCDRSTSIWGILVDNHGEDSQASKSEESRPLKLEHRILAVVNNRADVARDRDSSIT